MECQHSDMTRSNQVYRLRTFRSFGGRVRHALDVDKMLVGCSAVERPMRPPIVVEELVLGEPARGGGYGEWAVVAVSELDAGGFAAANCCASEKSLPSAAPKTTNVRIGDRALLGTPV